MQRRRGAGRSARAQANERYRQKKAEDGLKQLNLLAPIDQHRRLKKLVAQLRLGNDLAAALATELPSTTRKACKILGSKPGKHVRDRSPARG